MRVQGHDFNQYGKKRVLILGCLQEQANAILQQRFVSELGSLRSYYCYAEDNVD